MHIILGVAVLIYAIVHTISYYNLSKEGRAEHDRKQEWKRERKELWARDEYTRNNNNGNMDQ